MTGECIRTLIGHGDIVRSVSFNQQGLLASGSDDRTISICCIRTITVNGDSVESVSFNREGFLASGSRDKTIKLWERFYI